MILWGVHVFEVISELNEIFLHGFVSSYSDLKGINGLLKSIILILSLGEVGF